MEPKSVAETLDVNPLATSRCTICGDTFIDILEKHIYQHHNFKHQTKDFCDLCKNDITGNSNEHKCKKVNRLPVKISLLKTKQRDNQNFQSHSRSEKNLEKEDNLEIREKTKPPDTNEAIEMGSSQVNNETQSELDLKKTSVTKHRCGVCKK